MVMGIGIGYHYCFVSNSVEAMGKLDCTYDCNICSILYLYQSIKYIKEVSYVFSISFTQAFYTCLQQRLPKQLAPCDRVPKERRAT